MKVTKPHEIKPVDQLVFSDDFMFGAVMRDPEICKGVLERLLKMKIDHVDYPELQKAISPFYTKKGVRLDVYVADSERIFDVECQTYRIADIGKRTRYYQSMLDVDSLMKGADYSELKESYVLFICLDDPFGMGLPIYTFERKCNEAEEVDLRDKTHHIIYNCAAYEKEEDSELKDFLAFVKNNKAESDFTKEIANMVKANTFRQSFLNEYLARNLHERDVFQRGKEEGIAEGVAQGMAQGMAQGVAQGMAQGVAQGMAQGLSQGIAQGVTQTAKNLLSLGFPVKSIAEATGLSEEEILNLK